MALTVEKFSDGKIVTYHCSPKWPLKGLNAKHYFCPFGACTYIIERSKADAATRAATNAMGGDGTDVSSS